MAGFTDLEAWKINHELVKEIYRITRSFPKEERYGIVDQIRRAASSITANIAEGFGRFHYKDKVVFYYHSRGSNTEVQNFLILSFDLKYLSKDDYDFLIDLCTQGYQLICGLIRSTETRLSI